MLAGALVTLEAEGRFGPGSLRSLLLLLLLARGHRPLLHGDGHDWGWDFGWGRSLARDVCVGETVTMGIQGIVKLMLGAVWCSVRVDRIVVGLADFRAGCDAVLACAQLAMRMRMWVLQLEIREPGNDAEDCAGEGVCAAGVVGGVERVGGCKVRVKKKERCKGSDGGFGVGLGDGAR